MHVCFINPPIEYYSPVSGGAITTIAMQCARVLLDRGHRVSVLTPVNEDPVYSVGDVIPLHFAQRKDLGFLRRRMTALLRRVLRWDWTYYGNYRAAYIAALKRLQPSPDAVVVFNDLVAARHLRRVVPTMRIIVWLQNEQRTRQSLRQLSKSILATDVFLTCSQYIKDWTCQTHTISETKVVVAHSGVDLDAFQPPSDFPKDNTTLKTLFLGRIDPNKGPDLAADCVATLKAQGTSIELTVAGGLWFYGNGNPMADPYFRALRSKMDALAANYLGHVTRDRAPLVFREHDVAFVLSRSNEPFGLVALEAMASGCAVIASDRGGLPEACGGAAMLVNPDDVPSVVAALRSLATDRALLADQKRKALERASRAPWVRCAGLLEKALAGRN